MYKSKPSLDPTYAYGLVSKSNYSEAVLKYSKFVFCFVNTPNSMKYMDIRCMHKVLSRVI